MCSVDMHLVTYDWVEEAEFPWPDFSTRHMCRNYSAVHSWGVQHAVMTNLTGGLLTKPTSAVLRPLVGASV